MHALRRPQEAATSGSMQQSLPINTKLQLPALCSGRQLFTYLYELLLLW